MGTKSDDIRVIDLGPWDERESDAILCDWEVLNRIRDGSVCHSDANGASKDSNCPPLHLIESEGDCRIGYLRYNAQPADWNLILEDKGHALALPSSDCTAAAHAEDDK